MAFSNSNARQALRNAVKSNVDGDLIYDSINTRAVSSGTETLTGNQTVTGNAAVGGTLAVTGAQTLTGNTAINGDATVASSKTLAVTTADKLTVGGVIVPQEMVIVQELWPHASLKTRNLFYASAVGWTVTAIVYEPDIAEGTSSVVCTVCKVTGNNVAVAATTPMCTAFAVTGTAGTPVVATLTGTAADLVLAATNKIGCIFTGGDEFLDTGRGRLYIKLKRS